MSADMMKSGGGKRRREDPPAQVRLTESVMYEGYDSLLIETPVCRWWYHKAGGGFARLEDADGCDWIGYHNDPASFASGWYRGIPNAVNPEDCFHPGRDTCSSIIESSGPFGVTIRSRSNDALWECLWEVGGRHAVLTMLKAAHDYWFQYEGTPGGRTSEANYIVRSDGSRMAATLQGFTEPISKEKWFYVGDPSTRKAIFFAACDGDTVCDRWYRMEGPQSAGEGMVISAFGRGVGVDCKLTQTPRRFIVGMLENSDIGAASATIRAALDQATS